MWNMIMIWWFKHVQSKEVEKVPVDVWLEECVGDPPRKTFPDLIEVLHALLQNKVYDDVSMCIKQELYAGKWYEPFNPINVFSDYL